MNKFLQRLDVNRGHEPGWNDLTILHIPDADFAIVTAARQPMVRRVISIESRSSLRKTPHKE